MRLRRLDNETDYPMIAAWWTRRGGVPPPLALLPPVGVVSLDGDLPVACAFLYECKGGNVAMVEWEATNPDCHSAMTKIRGWSISLRVTAGMRKSRWCCRGSRKAAATVESSPAGSGRSVPVNGTR